MDEEDVGIEEQEQDCLGRGSLHSFDSEIAQVHGINAAILYQHLEWIIKRSHGLVKRTVKQLTDRYPYLTYKQVRLALDVLAKGPLTRRTARYGGATTYEFNDDYAIQTGKRIKFLVTHAKKYGVVAAVIQNNLEYFIRDNWDRRAEDLFNEFDLSDWAGREEVVLEQMVSHTRYAARCKQSVEAWAHQHPYIPLRTIERAFSLLVTDGALVKSCCVDRIPIWSLPKKDLDEYATKLLGLSGLKNLSAKRATPAPKGQCERQKGNASAKRATKLDLTPELTGSYDAVAKILLAEAENICTKKVERNNNGFASRTALASRVEKAVIKQTLDEVDVHSPTRKLKRKPRPGKHDFGWTMTRAYNKAQDDAGFGDLNE